MTSKHGKGNEKSGEEDHFTKREEQSWQDLRFFAQNGQNFNTKTGPKDQKHGPTGAICGAKCDGRAKTPD